MNPLSAAPSEGQNQLAGSLECRITPAKTKYYPGEPVELRVTVHNTEADPVGVYFGPDGIGAFSMEIRGTSGTVVHRADRFRFGGISLGSGPRRIIPGGLFQYSIVLNRWCSTRLPPGRYSIVFHLTPVVDLPDAQGRRTGAKAKELAIAVPEAPLLVVDMDEEKYREVLEALTVEGRRKPGEENYEWIERRFFLRNMITFAEGPLAVPYQLELLPNSDYSRQQRQIINSLAKSESLEAVLGLLDLYERYNDISLHSCPPRRFLAEGIYRLRDTGKPELVEATDSFVAKCERPAPYIEIVD
jgi:hypothetical protein